MKKKVNEVNEVNENYLEIPFEFSSYGGLFANMQLTTKVVGEMINEADNSNINWEYTTHPYHKRGIKFTWPERFILGYVKGYRFGRKLLKILNNNGLTVIRDVWGLPALALKYN